MARRVIKKKYVRRGKGKKLNKTQLRQVKRAIHYEKVNKFHRSVVTNTFTSTGDIILLSGIEHGDGITQRGSDLVRLVRLRLNYQAICGDTTNMVRVILFRWSADTTVTQNFPTIAGVLDTVDNDVFPWLTQHRYQDPTNYNIIYDALHALAGNGEIDSSTCISPYSGASQQVRRLNIYGKRLGAQRIVFDDDTEVVTGKNHLFMLIVSDSAPLSLIHPAVAWDSLLEFESL